MDVFTQIYRTIFTSYSSDKFDTRYCLSHGPEGDFLKRSRGNSTTVADRKTLSELASVIIKGNYDNLVNEVPDNLPDVRIERDGNGDRIGITSYKTLDPTEFDKLQHEICSQLEKL